jgi:hypothetical protein
MNDADRRRLFLARAQRLRETKVFRGNYPSSVTIWLASLTPTLVGSDFDEENLIAFAAVLRPFTLRSESLYIPRILNSLERESDSEQETSMIQHLRTEWRHRLARGAMDVADAHEAITSQDVKNLVENGYYFHQDPDKWSLLEGLSPAKLAIVVFRLIEVLMSLAHVVSRVADLMEMGQSRLDDS